MSLALAGLLLQGYSMLNQPAPQQQQPQIVGNGGQVVTPRQSPQLDLGDILGAASGYINYLGSDPDVGKIPPQSAQPQSAQSDFYPGNKAGGFTGDFAQSNSPFNRTGADNLNNMLVGGQTQGFLS